MKVDALKALFTYATASLVALGGMWQIAHLPEGSATSTILAGFVGAALSFLFVQETATRTARSTMAASTNGANGSQMSADEVAKRLG